MFYVEFLVDDEPYELELHPGMVFTKCVRCGKKIYGYCDIGAEIEPLCESCTPPPPDPKKKIIENLEKHLGVIFTEEEMDYWMKKGNADLFLEEIRRRQKASQREKRHHPSVKNRHSSTVKNREKGHHPSVKMIPASK